MQKIEKKTTFQNFWIQKIFSKTKFVLDFSPPPPLRESREKVATFS